MSAMRLVPWRSAVLLPAALVGAVACSSGASGGALPEGVTAEEAVSRAIQTTDELDSLRIESVAGSDNGLVEEQRLVIVGDDFSVSIESNIDYSEREYEYPTDGDVLAVGDYMYYRGLDADDDGWNRVDRPTEASSTEVRAWMDDHVYEPLRRSELSIVEAKDGIIHLQGFVSKESDHDVEALWLAALPETGVDVLIRLDDYLIERIELRTAKPEGEYADYLIELGEEPAAGSRIVELSAFNDVTLTAPRDFVHRDELPSFD